MDIKLATLEREAINNPRLWSRVHELKTRMGDEAGARVTLANKLTFELGPIVLEDVEIDWADGWANDPRINVRSNRIPQAEEFLYERKDNYYFAKVDCVCLFIYYDRPGSGFGGRTFHLTMKDGSIESLHGPWSGNSLGAKLAGFPPTMAAAGAGGAITIDALVPLLKTKGLGLCETHGGFFTVTSRAKYPDHQPYFNKAGNFDHTSQYERVKRVVLAPTD